MKILSLAAVMVLAANAAFAFSNATPVTAGYMTTVGCPSGQSSCFVPINPVAPTASAAAASSLILKASAGDLFGFSATSGASAGFVMVFDAASAPADGAVTPKYCYALPAGQTVGASYSPPASFSTGITLVFSTTGCFSKTASATTMFSGQVR